MCRYRDVAVIFLACAASLVAPLHTLAEEVAEIEPNSTDTRAQPLAAGQFGLGTITYSLFSFNPPTATFISEFDIWKTPAQTGDLVFAYLDTHDSGNQDATLRVFNSDAATLIEADTDDGPSGARSGSAVAGGVVAQDGMIFYELSGPMNNSGNEISPYRLYHAVVTPADSADEREGNDTANLANPISARIMRGGVSGVDVDFYKVFATAGARLVVVMDDNPDRDATNTDTELTIFAENGTLLATGDNVGSGPSGGGNANAAGAVIVPASGVYLIRVAHGGEPTALDTDYRFAVLVDGAVVVDRDTDGVNDSADNCPDAPNSDQADADGDGLGDVCDGCPSDGSKRDPGACGCGTPDTDTDGDGTPDCLDGCPENPNVIAPAGCGGCGGACGMGMAVSTPLSLLSIALQRCRRTRRPTAHIPV